MDPNVNPHYYQSAPEQQVAPVISVKHWMLTILLMAIPIVNIVMLFVWAFGGGTNPTKANYAKATLIFALIGIVFYVVVIVLFLGTFAANMNMAP
ncbi:putative membrane protein YdbT with pleckstrin-like domain [Paenibacillus phyllosphaerae]|uniref:Putative membrane protein YdbT with pleckstrin-like domain n=1 Tax=Paenibacillus phyllosphaerae TaxID=274593 RepID=A0A7W5B152_9BACL|nr:hypothetical protein [Paenibacillus phyllosphaerae]MBB3112209.1 putative membrane protein YdbT with pleckstrin-like domain [Paenibacillus phyllosphaerae]